MVTDASDTKRGVDCNCGSGGIIAAASYHLQDLVEGCRHLRSKLQWSSKLGRAVAACVLTTTHVGQSNDERDATNDCILVKTTTDIT